MSPAIVATILVLGLIGAVALLVGWVLLCTRIQSLWLAMVTAFAPLVLILWVSFYLATGGFE